MSTRRIHRHSPEETEEISQDLLLSLLPTVLEQLDGEIDIEEGMSNAEIAEYLGVHETTVSRISTGALLKMRRRAQSL